MKTKRRSYRTSICYHRLNEKLVIKSLNIKYTYSISLLKWACRSLKYGFLMDRGERIITSVGKENGSWDVYLICASKEKLSQLRGPWSLLSKDKRLNVILRALFLLSLSYYQTFKQIFCSLIIIIKKKLWNLTNGR